jgi:hypothetical protein
MSEHIFKWVELAKITKTTVRQKKKIKYFNICPTLNYQYAFPINSLNRVPFSNVDKIKRRKKSNFIEFFFCLSLPFIS